MNIGDRLKNLREEKALTQNEVAEKLDVSFQAVSSWEREEYLPDTENLIKLAELYDVSLSSIVEKKKHNFKTKQQIYNIDHMKTFIRTNARHYKLTSTIKALDFAIKAHQTQKRKKSDVPYIYHPLNMACHIFALNLIDDDLISACLLHDVIEDTEYSKDDLPLNDDIKEIVMLLSNEKTNDDNRDKIMKKYFNDISKNPKACIIKCIDRINNITTMSWGLSRDRIYRTIKETEEYFPKLLKVIKDIPDYNNAYYLLNYQLESMIDIYKRLL